MNQNAQTRVADPLGLLVSTLEQHFAAAGCEVRRAYGEATLVVPRDRLLETASTLRDHEDFGFEVLVDVCGVDYAGYGRSQWETEEASVSGFGRGVERDMALDEASPERFAVVYHLLSVGRNQRLRLRVFAEGRPPMVPSLIAVWNSANWFEREAFDLFGILFDGHPDLRRILTDYGFIGHPFRKDFPLIGQVEMRYDPSQQRVVYQPVSIEPRTLVPRVIRKDNRYLGDNSAESDPSDA
jgi:NADH-quinone oxidoreductase subunit C